MNRGFNSSVEKVFSREDIRSMSTDEINQFMSHFRKLIREARVSGKNTHDFEVEYCYLDNEQQSRSRYEYKPVKPQDRKPRPVQDRDRPARRYPQEKGGI